VAVDVLQIQDEVCRLRADAESNSASCKGGSMFINRFLYFPKFRQRIDPSAARYDEGAQ